MLLYAITDRASLAQDYEKSSQKLINLSANWASQGVNLIQIREKSASYENLLPLTRKIVEAVRQGRGRTRILVNADLVISTPVALEAGADGVHIPGGFLPEELAKDIAEIHSQWAGRRHSANSPTLTGPTITVACHTAADVQAARNAGATLGLFAPVFEKALPGRSSLPGKGLDELAIACRVGRRHAVQPELPVLALGGVTLANAAQCVAAGAAGIAAIRLFLEEEANPDRDWRSLTGI
jgi:thiamine-phosphate pyrophosphorylase